MLIPVLHRVLVKPRTLEEVDDVYKRAAKAGIDIPKTEQRRREEQAVEIGTVVAIGETAYKDYGASVIPEVGNLVYYAKYSGKPVKEGEVEYLLLNDEDIVAIIKE